MSGGRTVRVLVSEEAGNRSPNLSSFRNPRSPRRTTLWSSVIKARIVTASCPPLNL
jgi:hypothetical protein